MPKRSVREWLESSPWILIIGALAAVLTFGLNVFEQAWRIKETVTAPAPPQPSLRITRHSPVLTEPMTNEIRQLAPFLLLEQVEKVLAKEFGNIVRSREMGVWPIQLLVLNPTKDKLTLHSCTVFARAQHPLVVGSAAYFLGGDIGEFRTKTADPLIEVPPDGARRVDVTFVFPAGVISGIEWFSKYPFKIEKNAKAEIPTSARLDLRCEDQTGRTFNTSSSVRLAPARQR